MPAPASAVEFLELVKKSGLVHPESYSQVTEATLPPDPSQAAGVFVKRGWLTNFQAKQLLAGRYRGFRMGPYVVREQIGQGGMGIVYLAEHEQLRRRVALKVLTGPNDETRKVTLERFLREARAAAALDHPNIVRIHDVGQQGAVHYLVMEFVEGRTLDSLINSNGPVSAGRAVGYIAQAAAGLQHAHEKGFIHRDIKPGNLMLQADGSIKILDMGLARSFDNPGDNLTEQFDTGAVVGTADFISPEQALNDPAIDHRSDIYSLGATFYALVTGQPPFTGSTTQKLMQHQMREAPPLSSVDKTFPAELSDVIAKMMAKQPQKRFDTMAEVIEALTPWMPDGLVPAGGGVRATSSGSLRHTLSNASDDTKASRVKGTPIPKWALYVVAGVGAALLIGVIVWAMSQPSGVKEQMGTTAVGETPATATKATPPPKANPAPKGNTSSKPPASKSPASESGLKTTYRLNLADAKPFLARVVRETTEAPDRVVSQTGDGLPTGWEYHVWRPGATAEFLVSDETGTNALGIRTIDGKAGGMLFLPDVSSPDHRCVLTFDHKASKSNTPFGVKFRPQGGSPSSAYFVSHVTAGTVWAKATIAVDLKGATNGRIEIQIEDDEPDATVWLKGVTVQIPGGAAPNEPEKSLFKFDPSTLADFRVRKIKHSVASGDLPSFPAGVGVTCWKDDAEGEFWRDSHQGAAVLALASLSSGELISAQLGVELEAAAGVMLTEGTKYKLVVTYSTTGSGYGNMYFQHSDYTSISGQKDLPNTNGEWKTVETTVTRGEKSLRFLIDTKGVGLDNALLIRRVKIVEE
jgi:serine/threonine protein kinase